MTMAEHRILVVTGGRDHVHREKKKNVVEERLYVGEEKQFVEFVLYWQPTIFRHGYCRGVDRAAAAVVKRLVREMNLVIWIQRWPADWDRYRGGKGPDSAGCIRNGTMLRGESEVRADTGGKAHQLVAFPGNFGTGNCMRQARELSIPIKRILSMPDAVQSSRPAAREPAPRSEMSFVYEGLMRRRLGTTVGSTEYARITDEASGLWQKLSQDDRGWIETMMPFLRRETPRP